MDEGIWIDMTDFDPKQPYGKGKKMVFVNAEGVIKSNTYEEGLSYRIIPGSKKVGEKWK